MMRVSLFLLVVAASWGTVGCKRGSESPEKARSSAKPVDAGQQHTEENGHDGSAPDGQDHDEQDGHDHSSHGTDDGHGHGEEADLGTVEISDMKVAVAQGHGRVAAGKESHLVVKLPYSDKGSTVVRAWLGTEDRTLSMVGKAEYAPSHDEYSVHAVAPKPLPANVMWWIEIQKPDGTKAVGSVKPIMD